ncbi:TIGR03118 family protein [Ginsengibacter hankyongi]|nr:TIGR03118 family protein [Ginsengibacter hankyongi]
MQKIFQKNGFFKIASAFLLVLVALQACKKNPHFSHFTNDFQQVNLVATNNSYGALAVDPALLNGWGIAFAPSGPAWVSSNGAGLSNIYNASGSTLRPPVTIPASTSPTGGTPTGAVFNNNTGFRLSNGNPARFIFASEDGVISGWNSGNAAEVAKNNSAAVYKGITIAKDEGVPFLYVANFIGKKVEVYDTLWNSVNKPFIDPGIPADYSPFNVQNVDGKVYVVYAKLGTGVDEAHGPGTGIVDIYNPNGTLVKRLISHGELNAPWGITWTPASFWGATNISVNIILVGNFGNGRINAYDESGSFLGPLRSKGKPIVIDGLWGLSFAPVTATAINPNWLFFAAGPKDESDGVFGYITPVDTDMSISK